MSDLAIIAGCKPTQGVHPVKACKANSSAVPETQTHPRARKAPVILNEQDPDPFLVASQPELCSLF